MTNRDLFIRHAARHLIDGIRQQAWTQSACTIDAIDRNLEITASWTAHLSAVCQYPVPCSDAGKRRALAKAIAGAVANHPDLAAAVAR